MRKEGIMTRKNTSFRFFLIVCLILSAGLTLSPTLEQDTYDILIKNARVFDGSGSEASRIDVAVKGDTIVQVGRSLRGRAERTIDAKGLYLSPGFIDMHTHAERGMLYPENRAALNYLKQGVTSYVGGQCGTSAWPIFEEARDLIDRWAEEGIGPNAALLVGHGTVRRLAMGMEDRAPRPEELEKMKELVREAMEQGAHGISTGLIYLPGTYSKTDEIIELVKMVKPYDGIYHTHIRDERNKLLEAVKEAIEISETTGVPVHISHFKVMGKKNWGLVKEACALIEDARARGLTVTADQYPYRFSNGYPYRTLLPSSVWMDQEFRDRLNSRDIFAIFEHLRDDQLIELYKKTSAYVPISEGSLDYLDRLTREQLVETVGGSLISPANFRGITNPRDRMLFLGKMEDPDHAQKVYKAIEAYVDNLVGPENIIVGVCHERNLEGKSLAQVAALKGKSVGEAAVALELMDAKCIPLQMCEPDIEYIMKKDYVTTGSDGTVPFYGVGLTHIRSWSTFLHKIKKYALQRKTVGVAHVIRSQTSLPAQIMNWDDRGWIKEGYKADIVVFDLKNIKTPTSISNPQQYSEGVEYLLINGAVVLDGGRYTGELPGQVIKLNKN
jgi:N-acyl-D-aspartate/D-glutamate deacylase